MRPQGLPASPTVRPRTNRVTGHGGAVSIMVQLTWLARACTSGRLATSLGHGGRGAFRLAHRARPSTRTAEPMAPGLCKSCRVPRAKTREHGSIIPCGARMPHARFAGVSTTNTKAVRYGPPRPVHNEVTSRHIPGIPMTFARGEAGLAGGHQWRATRPPGAGNIWGRRPPLV